MTLAERARRPRRAVAQVEHRLAVAERRANELMFSPRAEVCVYLITFRGAIGSWG